MAITIDLTPSAEGFEQIAEVFVASISGDIRKPRHNDSMAMLDSVIEIASYLGAIGRKDLVTKLRDFTKGV